jgi:hypothetical protein
MQVNRQVQFANNAEMMLLQQKVIRQNAAGNGVFYRHHGIVGLVLVQRAALLLKGKALYRFDGITEIGHGGHFMKTGGNPLDGNSYFFAFDHLHSFMSLSLVSSAQWRQRVIKQEVPEGIRDFLRFVFYRFINNKLLLAQSRAGVEKRNNKSKTTYC